MIAYVAATAGVEELPEFEEGAQAHVGILDEARACACGCVEHPCRDFEPVAALVFVELADQYAAMHLR